MEPRISFLFPIKKQCFKSAKREYGTSSKFRFTCIGVYISFGFRLFHQHVKHLMILKSYDNCPHKIIMKFVRFMQKEHIFIANWESGTYIRKPGASSLFLVWVNVSDISKLSIVEMESGTGIWELVSCFLFWYFGIQYQCSKVQIGNKELVSGSFLTIFRLLLVWGLVFSISM